MPKLLLLLEDQSEDDGELAFALPPGPDLDNPVGCMELWAELAADIQVSCGKACLLIGSSRLAAELVVHDKECCT